MQAALAEAARLAADKGSDLALAMLDLDDFKQINDQLGHLIGDALLAAVADRLRTELRAEASAFRYGGEEFSGLGRLRAGEDAESLIRRADEALLRAKRRGKNCVVVSSD